MNEVQAKEILAVLPTYEIVDITVVSTDGKLATADVVYTRNGGELRTVRVEWDRLGRARPAAMCPTEEEWQAVVSNSTEIGDECHEACMYQRDLLRSKN